MSKFVKLFSVILLFIFTLNNSSATFFKASAPKNIIEKNNIVSDTKQVSEITIKINNVDKTPVNLWEILASFAGYYEWKIPESYKYINVNIVWVNKNSDFYKNIQKLIYVDILPNKKFRLNKNAKISAYSLYKLAEKLFNVNLISANNVKYPFKRNSYHRASRYLRCYIVELSDSYPEGKVLRKIPMSDELILPEEFFEEQSGFISCKQKEASKHQKSSSSSILINYRKVSTINTHLTSKLHLQQSTIEVS